MPKKYRFISIDGKRLNSKLEHEKKASRLVDEGVAIYKKRGENGSNSIQFTDAQAEKKYIEMLEKKKTKKKRIKDDNDSPNQCGISDYGMGGYNWKKGMSNRAVRAYLKGKVPISKITRKLLDEYGINITVKKAKDILIYEIGTCEYHHTSKYFNRTDFYNMHSLKEYVKKIRDKEI